MLTYEELTRLKELDRKASPAPWKYVIFPVDPRSGDQDSYFIDAKGNEVISEPESWLSGADFDLFIESRNALPKLLAEIDRLKESVWEEGYKAGVERARECYQKAISNLCVPFPPAPNPYREGK